MEFTIPKITVPLDLAGYSPSLAGQVLQVWVNPPLGKRMEYWRSTRRALEIDAEKQKLQDGITENKEKADALEKESSQLLERVDAWLSEIWSQGQEDTRLTAEYIRQFRNDIQDTDPKLFGWMVGKSVQLMMEHQGTVKKA